MARPAVAQAELASGEVAGRPVPGSGAGAGERLALLERRVSAQAAALSRVPLAMPVPRDVIALLNSPPVSLAGLPPSALPRVVALFDQLQALVEDLTLRERALAGRIACVRSARRAGPAAHLLDCSS
jgi:hypothetical protein